jgi:hypothetical protein
MIGMKKLGIVSSLTAVIAGSLTAAIVGFAGPAQASIQPAPIGPHYSVDNQDDTYTNNGFVDQAF